MRSPVARLDMLQKTRAIRASGRVVADDIARIQRTVERTGKRLATMIDLWEQSIPAELASQTRISSVRAGVAHVVVGSSGVLFEIDRLLRGGLERALIEQASFPLHRVKCGLGCLNDRAFASQ